MLAQIRATARDEETIYVIYVVDREHRLVGTVSLRDLVLAAETTPIADIMRREPKLARLLDICAGGEADPP